MPPTVLIVDDQPEMRALLVRVLREAGYETLETPDGRDAWLLLQRSETVVDIVLADVVMPQMTGTELASLVGTAHPGVPVVLMSGYSPADLETRGFTLGPDFIAKPFDPEDLLRRVQEVLRRQRAEGL